MLLGCTLTIAAGWNWYHAITFPLATVISGLLVLCCIAIWLGTRIAGLSLYRGKVWPIAAAHVLLVGAALWNFTCVTAEEPVAFSLPQQTEKVPVDDAVVVTDQGRIFSVFRFHTDDNNFNEQWHDILNQIVRVALPDLQSNCHGWVFANGRYVLSPATVAALLQDNGYSIVEAPLPGDVIVYRDAAGEIVHSGRVRRVHEDGQVWIESKWGPGGRYLHRPEDQVYSDLFTYYRSARRSHELQIVQTAPAADRRVARSESAEARPARG
jgi:hypothetical protein